VNSAAAGEKSRALPQSRQLTPHRYFPRYPQFNSIENEKGKYHICKYDYLVSVKDRRWFWWYLDFGCGDWASLWLSSGPRCRHVGVGLRHGRRRRPRRSGQHTGLATILTRWGLRRSARTRSSVH